jgi:hypothetical protein
MKEQTVVDSRSIVAQTLDDSFQSKRAAEALLANPAAVFRSHGLDIPKGEEGKFNAFFGDVAVDIQALLRNTSESQLSEAQAMMANDASFGCVSCQIATWTVALAIVGVGAGGLMLLTAGSPVVLALAAFVGCEATTALAFIVGLTAAVGEGTTAVTLAICGWINACAA